MKSEQLFALVLRDWNSNTWTARHAVPRLESVICGSRSAVEGQSYVNSVPEMVGLSNQFGGQNHELLSD
jgi:hypothetical protein